MSTVRVQAKYHGESFEYDTVVESDTSEAVVQLVGEGLLFANGWQLDPDLFYRVLLDDDIVFDDDYDLI